ncbi:response regulator [Thermodesulforhabdus norvegica]|uniref:response regulator n=1 Tax=Thermodesulforhabdus norvegica TaxID=39841 RepID=UPI001160B75E|nr:response regulator [Thermodesulforhabdus norvegica]
MKLNFVFLGNKENNLSGEIGKYCRLVSPENFDAGILEEAKGIAGVLGESGSDRIEELLLRTRFDPATCHIPFFLWGREWKVMNSRFWPRITGDVNCIFWNEEKFKKWCLERESDSGSGEEKAEWNSFAELLMWLIRSGKSCGTLNFRSSRGTEGVIGLEGETVLFCRARNLEGPEAFFDMMSWARGEFLFEPMEPGSATEVNIGRSFFDLYREYGLMLDECRHVFEFIKSLQDRLELAPDNCALDDKADRYFKGYEYICRLIDQGKSVDEILATAPLSAIRSLAYIYRLICFGDVSSVHHPRKDDGKEDVNLASCAIRFAKKHNVLVVDDAPFFQKVLKRILERDNRLVVAGTAKDGIDCLEKLEESDPDVITLDIEMPRLDGLGALKRIMLRKPRPVVVLSAFTGETSRLTYEAFKFGAVDVIEKPRSYSAADLEQKEREILERVARTACVQVEQLTYVRKRRTNNTRRNGSDIDSGLLFVNYFGEGSFSQFLKALSYGNWEDPAGRTIFILPLTRHALKHMYQYMIEDHSLPMEILPDEGEVEVRTRGVYLLGTDWLPDIEIKDDRISFRPGGRYNDVGEFIEAIAAKAIESGSYRPVVSAVSGLAHVANSFVRVAGMGGSLFYLNPKRCLFPDLAQSLRKAGVGYEVDTIEEMVQIWANPESYVNRPSTLVDGQAQ